MIAFGANHDYLAFGCCHTDCVGCHLVHSSFFVCNTFAQITLRFVKDGSYGVDGAVNHFRIGDFSGRSFAEQHTVAINLIFLQFQLRNGEVVERQVVDKHCETAVADAVDCEIARSLRHDVTEFCPFARQLDIVGCMDFSEVGRVGVGG